MKKQLLSNILLSAFFICISVNAMEKKISSLTLTQALTEKAPDDIIGFLATRTLKISDKLKNAYKDRDIDALMKKAQEKMEAMKKGGGDLPENFYKQGSSALKIEWIKNNLADEVKKTAEKDDTAKKQLNELAERLTIK